VTGLELPYAAIHLGTSRRRNVPLSSGAAGADRQLRASRYTAMQRRCCMVRCMILIHRVSVASATAAPCNRAFWTPAASSAPLSMADNTAAIRSAISRPASSRCDGDRPTSSPCLGRRCRLRRGKHRDARIRRIDPAVRREVRFRRCRGVVRGRWCRRPLGAAFEVFADYAFTEHV
jgi:hypothetical protein